jgi:hypothetical protein
MEQVYEPAVVESRLDDDGVLQVTTRNVAALSIARGVADRAALDGSQPFDLNSAADGQLPDVYFVRHDGAWQLLDYDNSIEFAGNPDLRKRHDLQGPIDDAFMQPFVCVRGTGTPWSGDHQRWCDWTLARFEREWDKWLRGRVPVVNDTDVTEELIATKHLVLFGDPGSNSVLSKVATRLPARWTRDSLAIAGATYDPALHGLVLIHPNPLNSRRYIVVNSGMTMHEKGFQASNAWLFPKLGDAAVIRFEADDAGGYGETTVWATLFDAGWKLP